MAVVELNRVGPESAAVPLRGIREALHRLRDLVGRHGHDEQDRRRA